MCNCSLLFYLTRSQTRSDIEVEFTSQSPGIYAVRRILSKRETYLELLLNSKKLNQFQLPPSAFKEKHLKVHHKMALKFNYE